MKKVIIIGGGIAGLAAGIYARSSGFDTTILEMHNIPGGNCTSWRRGGYLFEGGMHWLTGSKDGTPLNKLWRETGAITGDTVMINKDPYTSCISGGRQYHMYRDLEKTWQALCEYFPRDEKAIKKLCKMIKKFQVFSMPISDIKGLQVAAGSEAAGMSMAKMMAALPQMLKYNKIAAGEFLQQFSSKELRMLFAAFIPMEYSASSLMMTMTTFTSGDGGYIRGGSLQMAQNMAERYHSLGGKIEYKTPVEQVIVKGGKAVGVRANGAEHPADAVIIASDTRVAIDHLFEQPVTEPWAEEMRKQTIPQMCDFVCLGVEADLSHLPETMILNLNSAIEVAGEKYEYIGMNNYATYEGYAPGGHTACTSVCSHQCYEYWQSAKDNGEYEAKKQQLGESIIEAIARQLPELKGKIKLMDVATPLTYERYCGTYQGSWMSVMPANTKQMQYPTKMERVSNVYNAGHRMLMPGGMPVAVTTGRTAAQHLCRDNDTTFVAPSI